MVAQLVEKIDVVYENRMFISVLARDCSCTSGRWRPM